MIIAIHVLIALTSVLLATTVVIRPTTQLLKIHYGFVAATIVTGSYLLVAYPAHLAQSCAVGLVYLGVAATLSIFGQLRLKELSR